MDFALLFVVGLGNKAGALQARAVSSLQSNATNHGDPNIACTPTTWTDVASFFIGNYVAHAATVKSYPGEGDSSMVLAMMGALLLPTSGLLRGLNGIMSNAKFRGSKNVVQFCKAVMATPDYQTAAAAGALTMLVRTPSWQPWPGDEIVGVLPRNRCEVEADDKSSSGGIFTSSILRLETCKTNTGLDPEPDTPRVLKIYRPSWVHERVRLWTFSDTAGTFVDSKRTVHGSYDLEKSDGQYALAHVPRDAIIVPKSTEPTAREPIIAASYSFTSALVAVLHLIYVIVTFYQTTRGAQIRTYGYAAFGLTAVPYAIMSLVNLISALTAPSYSALVMVGSEVMDEALRRGATFDGVVGRLLPDNTTEMIIGTAESVLKCSAVATPGVTTSISEKQSAEDRISNTIRTSEQDTDQALSFSCRGLAAQTITYSVRPDAEGIARDKVKDTSPSLFIPSCSPFLRSIQRSNETDTNTTMYTAEGYRFLSSRGSNESLIAPSKIYVSILNGAILIGIIGGLSHFRKEGSTHSQRAWLMTWYIFGSCAGGMISMIDKIVLPESRTKGNSLLRMFGASRSIIAMLVYGVPSMGGFVVVAQMLRDYGTCTVKE